MLDKKIIKMMKRYIADAFNYEAEMEANNITQDDVDYFREILLNCEEVPKAVPDKMLLLILLMQKNNIDKCVRLARTYCVLTRESPEFFGNRDLESEGVQICLENQCYLSLPPTPDNCNLIFFKFTNPDPKIYDFDNAEKTFLMTAGE